MCSERATTYLLEPTKIYGGAVTVKMSANHVYYVQYDDSPRWNRSQGVTGALEELYDQRALINWAVGMASQAIVKEIALDRLPKGSWLDDAFLALFKGKDPVLRGNDINRHFTASDLIELYKRGINAPVKKADYGKTVGTQVHDAIDVYHRTGVKLITPSGDSDQDKVAQSSFDAYIKWYVKSGLRVLESERVVHSKQYNYCGTLDRIYIDKDGGLILGDFKTSNVSIKVPTGIRPQYWSQVGAYALAYSEETNVEFKDMIIVNSPKNGNIQVVRSSNLSPSLSPQQSVMAWKYDLQAFRTHKQIDLSMKGIKSEV